MNRRTLSAVFSVLMVLSLLAGCGPSQPAAQPAAPTAAAEPVKASPTQAPAAEPTKAPAAAEPTKAAAAAEPTKAPAATNETLVVAQSTDISSFEPMELNSRSESNIADHIFDRLLEMDEHQKLTPMLAESYQLLDDKKTWQFKLRKDVKFWDGEPLTAEVVKYCFDRGLDPNAKFVGNTPGYVFPSIGLKKVEVVDPYTVNFVLDRFEPDTPGYLSEVYIHSMKYYKDNSLEKVAAEPMGSGPYKLKEWVKDDHITLERWDGYRGSSRPSRPSSSA